MRAPSSPDEAGAGGGRPTVVEPTGGAVEPRVEPTVGRRVGGAAPRDGPDAKASERAMSEALPMGKVGGQYLIWVRLRQRSAHFSIFVCKAVMIPAVTMALEKNEIERSWLC